jgi:hypothetical protein
MRRIGNDAAQQQVRWREFLFEADAQEAEFCRGDWAIGSEAFRGQLARPRLPATPRQRGRPPEAAAGRITPQPTLFQ